MDNMDIFSLSTAAVRTTGALATWADRDEVAGDPEGGRGGGAELVVIVVTWADRDRVAGEGERGGEAELVIVVVVSVEAVTASVAAPASTGKTDEE